MEVICSVLVPMVSLRFFAMSVICFSVTWNGLSSAQSFSSLIPSRTRSDRSSRFSMTCQTTNQPTSPMTTKPRIAVTAVARPRGRPRRRSRTTKGWSSAVTSMAAANARTTRRTSLITFISTQSIPARSSSRQLTSAATRMPHGTTVTGSGRSGTAGTTAAGAADPGPAAACARSAATGSGETPLASASTSARRSSSRASIRFSLLPSRPSQPALFDMSFPSPRPLVTPRKTVHARSPAP